jgi:hypothetical protein
MKLLADAVTIAIINENRYSIPIWISSYNNTNWKAIPIEHAAENIAYCLKVCRGEKSLSLKVHALFRKKLEVIERIIPIKVALRYHRPDKIPIGSINDTR